MKEIGSEFWDVPVTDHGHHLFPEATQWYLSGRSALKAIIADLRDAHSVSMPSWCCDSMIRPFLEAGMEVRFYPVYSRNGFLHSDLPDGDVLLYMNYFGYSAGMPELTAYNGVTICDVTHSVFSDSTGDAAYSFGSLRKWCGLWTGGFAWTADGHPLPAGTAIDLEYIQLREEAMKQKAAYMERSLHDSKGETDHKSYLDIYKSAEERLDQAGIAPASSRDISLAGKLDVQMIRTRRRKNADILRSAFPEWIIFREMKDSDCPMFVPVLVPQGKRDALRQFLIDNSVYCPVHWPVSRIHQLDEDAVYLYENELSLVCDQRYTEEDMNRLVETIKQFWKEN